MIQPSVCAMFLTGGRVFFFIALFRVDVDSKASERYQNPPLNYPQVQSAVLSTYDTTFCVNHVSNRGLDFEPC